MLAMAKLFLALKDGIVTPFQIYFVVYFWTIDLQFMYI